MGYYDNYLEHHGILGMKWGVRRFEKAGGGLTTAGRARYQTDSNGDYKKIGNSVKGAVDKVKDTAKAKVDSVKTAVKEKTQLSDEQKKKLKKAAIIGAAAVGTALAAYGGYKLYKINKEKKAPIRFNLSDEPVNVDKELSIAKSLLDSKKVSETSKSNIRDAIDMVNKSSLDVGRDRASDASYKHATELLRAENDYANQFLKAKGAVRSESKQLKQEYKDFVKENTKSIVKDTSDRLKTLKEDMKKETNPYRDVYKAPKKSTINQIEIPRTTINRTEVKRTQVNYNDSLQKTLDQMSKMAATSKNTKVSSISRQQSDYTQELLKKNSKTLSNY